MPLSLIAMDCIISERALGPWISSPQVPTYVDEVKKSGLALVRRVRAEVIERAG